jgi:hypothetical protein
MQEIFVSLTCINQTPVRIQKLVPRRFGLDRFYCIKQNHLNLIQHNFCLHIYVIFEFNMKTWRVLPWTECNCKLSCWINVIRRIMQYILLFCTHIPVYILYFDFFETGKQNLINLSKLKWKKSLWKENWKTNCILLIFMCSEE